jgi:5-oxoprolinase (ATP-hydrolysing)
LHQSRPRIFDLNIKRPSPLYKEVVEVDERVTLVGYTSDPAFAGNAVKFGEGGEVVKGYTGVGSQNHQSASGNEWTKKEIEIVRGISGEAVQILQPLDEPAVTTHLKTLYSDGYRSIAVVLCHSYTYPAHELAIGRIAKEIGFEHISLSSQLVPMIKMVPRGISSTADAYLTPVLGAYLDGFYGGFEGGREGGLKVEFMGSDGGLCDLKVSRVG